MLPSLLIELLVPDWRSSPGWRVAILSGPVLSFTGFAAGVVVIAIAKRLRRKWESGANGEVQSDPSPLDARPDSRKYVIAHLLLSIVLVVAPAVTVGMLYLLVRKLGVGEDHEYILWITLIVGGVITLGSVVAQPFVHRAKQNANARWAIARRETRKQIAAQQTDTLPEGGPTLPE